MNGGFAGRRTLEHVALADNDDDDNDAASARGHAQQRRTY
jgi:hypothetical protein